MAVIQFKNIQEGEVFNKYLNSRMLEKNKNVILTVTGSTGSGKSYLCLRIAELWYDYKFNKPFPVENICFSIEDIMNRLNTGDIKRGEIIIMEEGGVLLGALDFQSKISKLFTYILQSFRSMNLCLMINLPHLSMLNKTARMLLHCNFVMSGVDYTNKTSQIKPFFHQVNQSTGKIYPKYIRVKIQGRIRKVQRFTYHIPSKDLLDLYEIKKKRFVGELVKDFVKNFKMSNETIKGSREDLTDKQLEMYNLSSEGLNQVQIAEKLNKSQSGVSQTLKVIKRKGYHIEKDKNA